MPFNNMHTVFVARFSISPPLPVCYLAILCRKSLFAKAASRPATVVVVAGVCMSMPSDFCSLSRSKLNFPLFFSVFLLCCRLIAVANYIGVADGNVAVAQH